MKEQEQRWIYFWLFRVALMLCVLIAAACRCLSYIFCSVLAAVSSSGCTFGGTRNELYEGQAK